MDVWRGIFFDVHFYGACRDKRSAFSLDRKTIFGLLEPIFMDIIGEEAVRDEQRRKQAIF